MSVGLFDNLPLSDVRTWLEIGLLVVAVSAVVLIAVLIAIITTGPLPEGQASTDSNALARLLDRIFTKRVIVNCVREPYLHRWFVLRWAWLGVFVHRFVRSDEDRALHDHPWSFIVIPLWGGYIEHSDRPMTSAEKWSALVDWANYPAAEGPPFPPINQRIPVKRRIWPIISTRYRGTDYRHRVELINGRHSWSLFIRFRKTREWGFWPETGFIGWNKWWQDKCE